MDYLLEAVFAASVPVSTYCFKYFSTNDKNPYPLTYFLFLVLYNIVTFLWTNKQCQINFIFYF